MESKNVILIFDIGKTNKKVLLFDESYQVVYERSETLLEITDEDGDPCESLSALQKFVKEAVEEVFHFAQFTVKAINFSAYGASFVYINTSGKTVTHLYNYLKPYPGALQKRFYRYYGDEEIFSLETASPVLGSLNSGLQLYRLKYEQPRIFDNCWQALHLPQFLSFLIAENVCSEITSIGCHTGMWNFGKDDYHAWVYEEGVAEKLPSLVTANTTYPVTLNQKSVLVGTGLHDSSAALVPYLEQFKDPFLLLSTGTWCISLNPFNDQPLTIEELRNDCLCYISYEGKPVKAARLFAGYEHEVQVKRLSQHFNTPIDYYHTIVFNAALLPKEGIEKYYGSFSDLELSSFTDYEAAYHCLLHFIICAQVKSTNLVLNGTGVKRIFVEGGFSKNTIFMSLLKRYYAELEIYAASMPQASAMGAALVIHSSWNEQPVPEKIVHLDIIDTITSSN